jgi:hypothetical protein
MDHPPRDLTLKQNTMWDPLLCYHLTIVTTTIKPSEIVVIVAMFSNLAIERGPHIVAL